MNLEENRVYKSRAGSTYKITKINKLAHGENVSPGYRIKVSWIKNGEYSLFDDNSPLDLIKDVTDDYPEEVL